MNVNSIARKSLLSVAALGLVLTIAAPSYAGQFQRNHPRRAEVNARDNAAQRRLNRNYGNLGGHYNQLSREDRNIHRQQRAEARANGGHITRGEQNQLNREENHLDRQINRDRR